MTLLPTSGRVTFFSFVTRILGYFFCNDVFGVPFLIFWYAIIVNPIIASGIAEKTQTESMKMNVSLVMFRLLFNEKVINHTEPAKNECKKVAETRMIGVFRDVFYNGAKKFCSRTRFLFCNDNN